MSGYLQKLPEACDNTTADKLSNIQPRGSNGGRVRASDAINPLHGQHPGTAQVPAHPGNLHLGVIAEVSVEVLHSQSHQLAPHHMFCQQSPK